MTRQEHLIWCKDRALAYLPNNPEDAIPSMFSDLDKHEETKGHLGISMGMMMIISGQLSDAASIKHFIDGFN